MRYINPRLTYLLTKQNEVDGTKKGADSTGKVMHSSALMTRALAATVSNETQTFQDVSSVMFCCSGRNPVYQRTGRREVGQDERGRLP